MDPHSPSQIAVVKETKGEVTSQANVPSWRYPYAQTARQAFGLNRGQKKRIVMENKALVPEDIPILFAEAWNARRADRLASLFEEDADFVNVVGIWWQNRSDIFKAHDYGLKVIFNESKLTVGKVKVKQSGSDCMVVHARMRLTGQTEHGGKAGLRQTMFIFVLRKHHEHWLCVSAQNTDIVAGAETNLRREDGNLEPVNYRNKK